MSEKEQIEKIKRIALGSTLIEVRKKAIDALSSYGEPAISAITDIIDDSITMDVRTYGLEIIKRIKEKPRD